MTKIAILGDTHIGKRSDSLIFHEYDARFYQNIFFPYCRKNNIKTVIQTGDLFDRRKFINFNTIALSKNYFFDEFAKGDLELITYLGNHDIYFKNTLEVNSPELILGDYFHLGNVKVIKKPTTLAIDGFYFDFIPWICADNEQIIKSFINISKKSTVCFGHFEIAGFLMEKELICNFGMDRSLLSKYEMVISGHFHHKSSDGHIFYVGTPSEMTWADYNDDRGFHVFDTETRSLEFIKNPYKMFYKLEYDDSNETLDSINNKDYSEFHNTYVKVIVKNKTNPVLFDQFIGNFYKAVPADLNIVEDFTDYNNLTDLIDGVDQADTTNVILNKYIDGIELGIDKEKLKSVMQQIYNQAETMESVW